MKKKKKIEVRDLTHQEEIENQMDAAGKQKKKHGKGRNEKEADPREDGPEPPESRMKW